MEQHEGKIFNLKPQLTTAMLLAASFAITYYGLLLIYEIFTLVYSRYFIDSYYFNEGQGGEGTSELIIQIIQLVLSAILVFSHPDLQEEKLRQSHLRGSLIAAHRLPTHDDRLRAMDEIRP